MGPGDKFVIALRSALAHKAYLLRLLGPVLFLVFLARIGPNQVISSLLAADVIWFAAAVTLVLPSIVLKGIRWRLLLSAIGIETDLRTAVGSYAGSMALGAVTPGQLGEFSKVLHLADAGHGYGRGFAASLLDRLFDVLVLFGVATWGLLVMAGAETELVLPETAVAVGLVAVALVAVAVICGLSMARSRLFLAKLPTILRQLGARENVGRLALVGVLSMAYVGLQCLAVYFCALATGGTVGFGYLAAVYSLSALVAVLPVTVAGIGTRDALFLFFLVRSGWDAPAVVALSTLVLGLKVLNVLVLASIARGCRSFAGS